MRQPVRVVLAAGGTGLGGVRFNERVVDGLTARLGADVDVVRVASLRSEAADAGLRLPMSALGRSPLAVNRLVGAAVWRGQPTHRMDIRLPPARHEVVSVLDFAPLHFDDEGSVAPWVLASLRRARGALCLSPSVADEVTRLADIPTWVTGAGFDARFEGAVLLDEPALARLGVPAPYVLSVGGTTRRKNLPLLAASWARVRDQAPLTLVSIGPNTAERRRVFADTPGVVVLDQVADDVIPGLLAGAAALVVPSLYEGFGMPVVEAMAAGTPVVTTNLSSLPWVAGDAALVVEADPVAFARAVLRVCHEPAVRDRLVAAGAVRRREFTWDRVVQHHVEAYQEAFA